jgi:hypothetical protein
MHICSAATFELGWLSGERAERGRALITGMALLAVVAALGCNSSVCSGVATCYGDQLAQCQDVPDCAPTPGCMVNPVISQDCPTAATQTACLVLSGCSWSNGACGGPCSAPADRATCLDTLGCSWSACTGNPRSCGDYSANSCPTSPIGCFVGMSESGVVGE